MKFRLPALITALIVIGTGCYSGPNRRVTAVDPNTATHLTGKWNDTDSNATAKVMMRACLNSAWYAKFKAKHNRNPRIKLYTIRNRTSQHVQTKFFTKKVEEELLNSGNVGVVSASDETEAARREKDDQSKHASDATKKEHRQEKGADFLLNGWIVLSTERSGGTSSRAYMVTMELTSVEGQEKTWTKTHNVKKMIQQSETSW